MIDESSFHRLADATLDLLAQTLEESDEKAALEVDIQQGVLTVELPSGKQYLISKHGPSRQLWLSSPLSGGLHFTYGGKCWILPDGRELTALLAEELQKLTGISLRAALPHA